MRVTYNTSSSHEFNCRQLFDFSNPVHPVNFHLGPFTSGQSKVATDLKTWNALSSRREHFSGEIVRKRTVCYTVSEACTFVRMSLSLYEPHKVALSVVLPLYLRCEVPTVKRERESKTIVYAPYYVYRCRRFRVLMRVRRTRDGEKETRGDLRRCARRKGSITRPI